MHIALFRGPELHSKTPSQSNKIIFPWMGLIGTQHGPYYCSLSYNTVSKIVYLYNKKFGKALKVLLRPKVFIRLFKHKEACHTCGFMYAKCF